MAGLRIPDSVAGERLRHVLDAAFAAVALDAEEVFHPTFLAAASPTAVKSSLATLSQGVGDMDVDFDCDDAEASDHRVSGVVRGSRGIRRIVCQVHEDPPHQITRLFFAPVPFEIDDIDDIDRLLAHHQCTGLTAAVLVDGEIAWARGWGIADADAQLPMTADTMVQVGSISKPVAAAAVAVLAADGVIDLDADVNQYLTSWRLPATGSWQPTVTLRQILTHTAGLSVWGFPGYASDPPTLINVLDGRGNTPAIRAEALPGAMWRYSGGGYTVMQQLLEDVCGDPFDHLMKRLVLDPYGMTRSTYQQPLPPQFHDDRALSHLAGQVAPDRIHIYPEMAAAGLWTTPSDLLRFALNMPPAMNTPSDVEPTMGLGIFLAGDTAFPTLNHAGGNYGVAADLAWTADGRIGFAAMVNDGNGAVLQDFGRWIALQSGRADLMARSSITSEAMQGMQRVQPIEHCEAIDSAIPDPRATRYEIRPGWSVEITTDRHLVAPGQAPLPLYPQTPTRWASRDLNVLVEFDGETIIVKQLGRHLRGEPHPAD